MSSLAINSSLSPPFTSQHFTKKKWLITDLFGNMLKAVLHTFLDVNSHPFVVWCCVMQFSLRFLPSCSCLLLLRNPSAISCLYPSWTGMSLGWSTSLCGGLHFCSPREASILGLHLFSLWGQELLSIHSSDPAYRQHLSLSLATNFQPLTWSLCKVSFSLTVAGLNVAKWLSIFLLDFSFTSQTLATGEWISRPWI